MAETVRDIFDQVINVLSSLGQTITVWDILDVLIITFLIYKVLSILKRTSASSVIQGLAIILIVAWFANVFEMNILSYFLRQILQLGIVVIVVLFQPEIRKFFERIGTTRLSTFFRTRRKYDVIEAVIEQVVLSCVSMSGTKTGALIVFERKVGLNDYAITGVSTGAEVSKELIESIFFENTPMHDGAMIIRDDKILAAACMLPLSTNFNIIKELGMRHRAGVGISERSDAVVVLVSEQTGGISVAIDGMLKRNLDEETLRRLLINEVVLVDDAREKARREKHALKTQQG